MRQEQESLIAGHEALARFLAQHAGAKAADIVEARPLSGGAIQENWRLDVKFSGGPWDGTVKLVLRSDAPSQVSVSLSRAQEYALLCAAEKAGVAVPEPLWLCQDPEIIGRSFYVMRFIPGVALGPKVVKDKNLGGDREALVERLGRELARIHTIRPPRADLDFLTPPDGNPALAAVAKLRGYLDELGEPRPALEWGLRWAEMHAPEAGEVVLVHQDFRTGNLLLNERGLAAILDWEFCDWGDPMSDIGWFCARCWRFSRPDLEAGGLGSRERFYKGYESEAGRTVDHQAVAFW
ncbi:MAG: phosphotransferase family protein, partial [Rhodovibrionaceae bacterium]|nr:phosphotransferase family protein [Rhodovibrionaceae bacterium]